MTEIPMADFIVSDVQIEQSNQNFVQPEFDVNVQLKHLYTVMDYLYGSLMRGIHVNGVSGFVAFDSFCKVMELDKEKAFNMARARYRSVNTTQPRYFEEDRDDYHYWRNPRVSHISNQTSATTHLIKTDTHLSDAPIRSAKNW